MRIVLLAGLLLSLAVGCQLKQAEPEPATQPAMDAAPPAGPSMAQIRKALEQNPTVATVGVVQDVEPVLQLAVVAEMQAAAVKAGDPISFISQSGITSAGEVVGVKDSEVQVSFKGSRTPARGDLVVRFK